MFKQYYNLSNVSQMLTCKCSIEREREREREGEGGGRERERLLLFQANIICILLATKGSAHCNFPEFLWRPMPDGGERKWLNRAIYNGNAEIWTRRKEIVVFHNEIIASLVSRVPCSKPSNSTAPPGVCERTKVRVCQCSVVVIHIDGLYRICISQDHYVSDGVDVTISE